MAGPLSDESIIEARLLTSPVPLTEEQLLKMFEGMMDTEQLEDILRGLQAFWSTRGIELRRVAAGWRFQSHPACAPYFARSIEEKLPHYSRAAMETLAIIAYRQPVTRGEVEEIRGVKVNPEFIRLFLERNWIEVVGRKDCVGHPELLGTTQQFLDDLGIVSLAELPKIDAEDPENFALFETDADVAEKDKDERQQELDIGEPPADTAGQN